MEVRDVFVEPSWKEEDLGLPIPDDAHAVSMCLPTWDSVIGYEEGYEKVMSKLQLGYPRFFTHPLMKQLFAKAENDLGLSSKRVCLYPTRPAAQRAQRYIEQTLSVAIRITSYESVFAVVMPEECFSTAMNYWRFTGEMLSSRQAEDILKGQTPEVNYTNRLRDKLSQLTQSNTEDIYLFESGMSATFTAHRIATEMHPGKKTLQIEFPYVDTLKIQNHFGSGVAYLNNASGEPFEEAIMRIIRGEFGAVFCEAPSNPLLKTADLTRISEACRQSETLFIIDDTVCSHYNVDVLPYADILVTSLSKWISGKCNLLAGSVRLNPDAPVYHHISKFFEDDNPSGSRLYSRDEEVLLYNSDGFIERIQKANANGEMIADLLLNHDAVDKVFYPKFCTKEMYDRIKTDEGGYGGLISFTLKSPKKAPKVYDSLEICKGPSLGTDFSLACPYTIIAHYDELEWTESCGVESNLIRISIGTEPIERLLEVMKKALQHA